MTAIDPRPTDSITRVIDQEAMTKFAGLLAYRLPGFSRSVRNHHTDPEIAKQLGLPGTVAQALHYCAFLAHLMLEKHGAGWYTEGGFEMAFLKPVLAGDEITVSLFDDGPAQRVEVTNQRDELVAVGTVGLRE